MSGGPAITGSPTTAAGKRLRGQIDRLIRRGYEVMGQSGELRTALPHFEQAGKDFTAYLAAEAEHELARRRRTSA